MKTGWFDTHPADRDRIRRAALAGPDAAFADRRPAAILFTDFAALARGTTGDMYRAYFGSRFQPSQMCSTEALLKAASEPIKEREPIPLD